MTSGETIIIRGEVKTRRVWINGKELTPERSQRVFNHSPGGFSWGYGGSGPAQLALAILLELTDEMTAAAWYQDFKWGFVSRLPEGDFEAGIPAGWLDRITERKEVTA